MTPLLIAGGAVIAVLLLSHSSALPLMHSVPRGPPGPQSQQTNKAAPPVPGSPPPLSSQTPNATLQTLNQGIVLVNNGLGLLDKINSMTDSSPSDSEYPIAAQPESDSPIQAPPSISTLNIDTTEYGSESDPFNSLYTS